MALLSPAKRNAATAGNVVWGDAHRILIDARAQEMRRAQTGPDYCYRPVASRRGRHRGGLVGFSLWRDIETTEEVGVVKGQMEGGQDKSAACVRAKRLRALEISQATACDAGCDMACAFSERGL